MWCSSAYAADADESLCAAFASFAWGVDRAAKAAKSIAPTIDIFFPFSGKKICGRL
jgi:hypothetical protein